MLSYKEALLRHHQEWEGCKLCSLEKSRYQVVRGTGAVPADIAIVGDFPSAAEDSAGKAGLGLSTNLVSYGLEMSGISIEEVFHTKLLSCRPPAGGEISKKQISTCLPRLKNELYVVNPALIISLGSIAGTALLGRSVQLLEQAGKLRPITVKAGLGTFKTALLPLYSPMYILLQTEQIKEEIGNETFLSIHAAIEGLRAWQRLKGEVNDETSESNESKHRSNDHPTTTEATNR